MRRLADPTALVCGIVNVTPDSFFDGGRLGDTSRAVEHALALVENDVRALRLKGALTTAAALRVPVCVMHMQGVPRTMQLAPTYTDVVAEVRQFLVSRVEARHAAGIADDHIVLDPGFGFGKALAHNLEVLSGLRNIASLGMPVMAGLSRKDMQGQITGREVADRCAASVAAA